MEQHRTGTAGNVNDTAAAVQASQLQIKILKALIVVMLTIHGIKIAVIILGHIFVIM